MIRRVGILGSRVCCSRNSSGSAYWGAYKNEANYAPLSPVSLFRRTQKVYGDKLCYVSVSNDGLSEQSRTWGQVSTRVVRLASALRHTCKVQQQSGHRDVVSIIAPNSPSVFEAHFAVPLLGAVLHTINIRLDAHSIAFQLKHANTKVLIVDSEFADLAKNALEQMPADFPKPIVVQVFDEANTDPLHASSSALSTMATTNKSSSSSSHYFEYEELLSKGNEMETFQSGPKDELDPIALNYTSGTTGNPKGVVLHHRGAYLNALSNIVEWNMPKHAKYLWIVPMFHCNGWVFPWSMAAQAGTSYFLRRVRAKAIFDVLSKHKVSYLAGAPITMLTMLDYKEKFKLSHKVQMWTAGAPPPPSVMQRFANELGIEVQTCYGLTETYGIISNHISSSNSSNSAEDTNSAFSSVLLRQTHTAMQEEAQVLDPETLIPVREDGKQIGEIMIKGNIVMSGYLNNEKATKEAFSGGWFRSGDLGVSYGAGRFEIKDRSKDIIISGGENIASGEVEDVMLTHKLVAECAVIGMPHAKWGEVPVAFIVTRAATGASDVDKDEMLKFARSKLAGFQSPKAIFVVSALPKTGTGKVQKNELRKLLPKE